MPTPTLTQRLKIALDVARGMAYLHGLDPRVMHRDLKTENVILARELLYQEEVPMAKVVDFGLSRAMARGATDLTRLVGTPRWMAPETMTGGLYDGSVDIYAFALLLYECLALCVPFGDDERALPQRLELFVASGGRPDDIQPLRDAPPWAEALLRRAWAQQPTDRPSFAEIVAELEAHFTDPSP